MCPSGQAIVANNTVVNGSSVGCELVLPMRMLTQLLCLNVRVSGCDSFQLFLCAECGLACVAQGLDGRSCFSAMTLADADPMSPAGMSRIRNFACGRCGSVMVETVRTSFACHVPILSRMY
jgi:hypothetical protein